MLGVTGVGRVAVFQLLDETHKRTKFIAQTTRATAACLGKNRPGQRANIIEACRHHPFIIRRKHIPFLGASTLHPVHGQNAIQRGTLTDELSIVTVANHCVIDLIAKRTLHGQRARDVNVTANGEHSPL